MTDEEYEKFVPELSFQFLIFQPYPPKDIVYYYLDGSESRRVINRKHFINFVQSKTPELGRKAYEACLSTSFFLYTLPDKDIIHLSPKTNDPYSDNLTQVFKDVRKGNLEKHIVSEKRDLLDVIANYGFNAPSEDSIKNLRVSMHRVSNERKNLLQKFFAMFTK